MSSRRDALRGMLLGREVAVGEKVIPIGGTFTQLRDGLGQINREGRLMPEPRHFRVRRCSECGMTYFVRDR